MLGIIFRVFLQTLASVVIGFAWYDLLSNDFGKYGVGDGVDRVQSILMGAGAWLLSGVFLFL